MKTKPLDAIKAWRAGYRAKKLGMMRVSPYYEHPQAEKLWFAGYDGIPFYEVDL